MNFNGTYLKSFGQCKVLSWKNSIYSDFDRKEISHNGRILAAVEVPTTRKINAAILVRGASYDDIQNKLERISDWLVNAGIAKLCRATDLTRYYMARCTQVSVPEYNGLSARITATFTCNDHRLYSSANDQPEDTAENYLSNFTFAGKHCLNDMGCIFVKDSEPVTPAIKAHVYEISGMSGTLRYNTGRPVLKETVLSGTLYFVKDTANGRMSESEITSRRHAVASWLINAERSTLVLDSDINREYQAEIVDETSLTRSQWYNGMMKVKFVVQPVSMSTFESSVTMPVSTTANGASCISLAQAMPNGFNTYETPLNITITHNGGAPITNLYVGCDLNTGLQIAHKNFVFEEYDSVEIDSENGSITFNDRDPNSSYVVIDKGVKYIKSGDFPFLVPGKVLLYCKANAAADLIIKVRFRERWV